MGRRNRKKLTLREVARSLFGTEEVAVTISRPDVRPARLPRGWYTFEVRTIDSKGRTSLDLYAWYVNARATDDLKDAARSAAVRLTRAETGPPQGWYTFEVRAIDAAGRTASNVYSWFVETAQNAARSFQDPATEVA